MDSLTQNERAALFYDDTETWRDKRNYQLSDRLWRNRQDVRRRIDETIREGIRTGRPVGEIATQLEQYIDPAYQRSGKAHYPAMRLAGNEVRRANAIATQQVAKTDPSKGFLRYRVSAGHIDPDECTDHAGHDEGLGRGVWHAKDCPLPPRHIGCFPAGTIVSARGVEKAMIRWWDGELIEIVTANGHFLSVTPNHPILTPQGWIAAGFLNEGDKVVSHRGSQGVEIGTQPDGNYGPAPIEQVAESLVGRGLMRSITVPTTAEDFHGDGIVNGEVHIVATDGLLRSGGSAALGKPRFQHRFTGRNMGAVALTTQRHLGALFIRVLTACGSVGRFSYLLPLFGTTAGSYEASSLTAPTERNVLVSKESHEGSARDTDFLCKLLERDAGLVALDQIVGVRRYPFSGHVYNLETKEGWYICNNIIAHNCACSVESVPWEDTGTQAAKGMSDFVEGLRVEFDLGDPPDLSPADLAIFRRETAGIRAAVTFMFRAWFQQTGLVTPEDLLTTAPTVAGWVNDVKRRKARRGMGL